jgi:hypothetical protein
MIWIWCPHLNLTVSADKGDLFNYHFVIYVTHFLILPTLCPSAMSNKNSGRLPRGVVKRRLIGAYRKAKVKLKKSPSETDSVSSDSDLNNSEPEAEVM